MNATSHQPATTSSNRDTSESGWWQPTDSGFRQTGNAFLWACVMMAPFLALDARIIYDEHRKTEAARIAAYEAAHAYEHMIASPAGPTLIVAEATKGRNLFMLACISCHGQAGTGMPGLGKNLVLSNFAAAQTDPKLQAFLVMGRPEAWPVGMPPKAGREDLTDDDLRCLVVYLRGLQDSRRMPELAAWAPPVAVPPTEAEKAAAFASAGGDAELAEYIASGTKVFNTTCIACHGKGGRGDQRQWKAACPQ